MNSTIRVLALATALFVAAGSATIIKGTSQPVTFATNPPGAQVFVDNQPVGVSPVTVNVKHGDHSVSASMNGYAPGYARMTSSFSGWTLLNVPLGVIWIVVDIVTGSITTLDQDTVIIQLAPGTGMPQPLQPGPVQPPGGSAERH